MDAVFPTCVYTVALLRRGTGNVGREYIGFHGTPDRSSIGKAVSGGCVRMYNKNVLELYEMVKLGTPVLVEP
ncbi:L,D-transpeptidase [uncultured Nostoc sp.]|uniref:L,D-transpeptidase n=1 Tax=uncultured Nostoc sp. TaxID=340711 RepID=UPI0035CBBF9F